MRVNEVSDCPAYPGYGAYFPLTGTSGTSEKAYEDMFTLVVKDVKSRSLTSLTLTSSVHQASVVSSGHLFWCLCRIWSHLVCLDISLQCPFDFLLVGVKVIE